jgi:5-methyltetrahydrofolate--homocysteine methyltransferase
MRPLAERLAARDLLVGDGAMGTMLLERGLAPGACPESITLTCPEVLGEIAALYLDAGAELLETNTFGASPLKLALHGLEAHTEVLNRDAVLAVRRIAGERAYVAGSCGPCGRLLEPYGDTRPEAVFEGFRRQLLALVAAGVDCVCVETMTDLAEATLAVRAAKEVAPVMPVLATMTFDPTPRGYFTIMGVSVAAAAAGLAEAGADAIGSNCGNGIEHMIGIAREFRRASSLPLIIQPNAGLPRMVGGQTVYDETPEFMAERARELVALGVSVVGGCCGTTPAHTRALRRTVDALRG